MAVHSVGVTTLLFHLVITQDILLPAIVELLFMPVHHLKPIIHDQKLAYGS